jgi:hypothetical protein
LIVSSINHGCCGQYEIEPFIIIGSDDDVNCKLFKNEFIKFDFPEPVGPKIIINSPFFIVNDIFVNISFFNGSE